MTAKQYLSQAYRLDEQINCKLDQLARLKTLATHITSRLSDIKVQSSHDNHQMEDTALKIVEQERELDDEIDALVDLKFEIKHLIGQVENIDHRILLEKRYLEFENWNRIAEEMNYSVQHIFFLHTEALKDVEFIRKSRVNEST